MFSAIFWIWDRIVVIHFFNFFYFVEFLTIRVSDILLDFSLHHLIIEIFCINWHGTHWLHSLLLLLETYIWISTWKIFDLFFFSLQSIECANLLGLFYRNIQHCIGGNWWITCQDAWIFRYLRRIWGGWPINQTRRVNLMRNKDRFWHTRIIVF